MNLTNEIAIKTKLSCVWFIAGIFYDAKFAQFHILLKEALNANLTPEHDFRNIEISLIKKHTPKTTGNIA